MRFTAKAFRRAWGMGGDWQTLKLGDLGKVVTGKTPSKNEKNAYGKDIPFVTPRDMDGCRIIKSTERSLSVRGAQTVRNSIVPPNSVAAKTMITDIRPSSFTIQHSAFAIGGKEGLGYEE